MSLWLLCCCALTGLALADPAPCPGNTTAQEITAGVDLSAKTAVVTGGDSGLGFAIARAFAQRGARVIIGSHNGTKGDDAAKQIAQETGSDVRSLQVDYTSFASVRAFAQGIMKEASSLSFLVNNAGSLADAHKESEDGFDAAFQLDYLGHFLLTELLLPLLRVGSPSRVISTSGSLEGQVCQFAGLPDGCLSDWSNMPPPVIPAQQGSNAVMGIFLKIQHMAELARREASSGVEAFSFEPGLAITPLTEHVDFKKACASMPYQDPCPYTADQAVSVAMFCALKNARNGAYFSRSAGCIEGEVGMNGFREDMRPGLYARSLQWTKLDVAHEDVVVV